MKRKDLGQNMKVLSRKGHKYWKNHNVPYRQEENCWLKEHAMQYLMSGWEEGLTCKANSGCAGQVWGSETGLGARGKPNCLGLFL